MLAFGVGGSLAADWWEVTVVDNEGWTTVLATSLAVQPDGEPAISYVHNPGDWGGYDLKYACCEQSAWSWIMVDEFIGNSTSLGMLPNGEPAIAYEMMELRYAWRDELGWHTTLIEDVAPGGGFTSLVILPSGYPAISYARGQEPYPDRDLKYAWFDGSQWLTMPVDEEGDVGLYSSLALQPSNAPAISYYDAGNAALKYAWYLPDIWEWVVEVVDTGGVGKYGSLAMLPSGAAAVSYHDAVATALKYACRDGDEWVVTTVDAEGVAGLYTSLAVLPSGQPAISYFNGAEIRFAWCDGSTWRTSSVCASAANGGRTSLVILPSGQPAISFYLADPDGGYGASALACAQRRAASGDCNCDGVVDYGDIDPFVLALSGADAYLEAYPDCNWLVADANDDGTVNYDDIDPFVDLLGS